MFNMLRLFYRHSFGGHDWCHNGLLVIPYVCLQPSCSDCKKGNKVIHKLFSAYTNLSFVI